MKYRVTKRDAKANYNIIVLIPYCGLQHLLSTTIEEAYSDRREGWACDYYNLGDGIYISSGYAPIGKRLFTYEEYTDYDRKAEKICASTYDWKERKAKLQPLIDDFKAKVRERI